MPSHYTNNELMNRFCKMVKDENSSEINKIYEERNQDFNINYVVPDDVKEIGGCSALNIAIKYGHNAIVKYLIEQCGADVNMKDSSEATPLFFAVNALNEAVVDLLLKHGAKTNIKASLEAQPLKRLSYIFDQGQPYYDNKTFISIYNKLIQSGADTSEIDAPDFFAFCNSTFTPQLTTTDSKSLYHEEAITGEWNEFINSINNTAVRGRDQTTEFFNFDNSTILGGNRTLGTVHFNNLIHAISSAPPWVIPVSSISIVTGIIVWCCSCLKKSDKGSHQAVPDVTYTRRKSFNSVSSFDSFESVNSLDEKNHESVSIPVKVNSVEAIYENVHHLVISQK